MSDILPDGCFPKHDSTKSYCTEYKGRTAQYPMFRSFDELHPVEYWSEKLGISRRVLADARYFNPPLPYLRLGKRILMAESQLVWWFNEIQSAKPDKYFLDRRRRLMSQRGLGAVKPK